MQKRSFSFLLVATLALLAGAGAAFWAGDRAATPPRQGTPALPLLAEKLGDLAWMRLTRGAMVADFTAIGGRWVVVEKGNYPASPQRMRRLLHGLADLKLLEAKTKRPELLPRLDLDDPKNGRSTLVALQDRAGRTVAELIVGKSRPDILGGGNDGVYVRKPGDNQAWLAPGSLDLSGDIAQWLDRPILGIAASRIVAVRLTGADGKVLALRRGAAGGNFAVADAPADAKFKDATALDAPAAALADLELDDVKPAALLPLPANGVAQAVFTTDDALTVTLRLFARDKTDWVAVAAAGSGAAAAEAKKINARVAGWSYAIPADRVALLRTGLAALLAPAKGS
ncbi:MAG TPA: DUF4340 domain-containing protein [Stellaceae bacterium]|nr:DUF4340 domain-containing protein [Stellaceae bacterium]